MSRLESLSNKTFLLGGNIKKVINLIKNKDYKNALIKIENYPNNKNSFLLLESKIELLFAIKSDVLSKNASS